MLYTLDVNLPHEQIFIIPVFYNLELIKNRGQSMISIHHRDQTFRKSRIHLPSDIRREINDDIYVVNDLIYFPRDVKSRAYQFSSQFNLDRYSMHEGDFTKSDFRWLETRKRLYESKDIPYKIITQSYKLAERLWNSINRKKRNAKKIYDKDFYARFTDSLEEIIKNNNSY